LLVVPNINPLDLLLAKAAGRDVDLEEPTEDALVVELVFTG